MIQKYDNKTIEQKWLEYWNAEKLHSFNPKGSKKLFVVDTPPPYVSADHLHAGHIMSYAQAEFIVRYKRMRGFDVYYPMGFDDNGLPTERFVEKKYNVHRSKISRSDFIKLCLKETKAGSETYKKLWNALGISVDWDKTYSTIGETATKVSQWSIIDLYKKKALYRDSQPILWCVHCRTALAQADLEDEKLDGYLNYFQFDNNLVVATTRPELLPACVALYVNPNDKRYSVMVGKKVKVPIFGHSVQVLASDKVDQNFGTGLMMVCTWGDQEDVEKWKNDKLPKRLVINEDGKLNHLAGPYKGMDIRDARAMIMEDLGKLNLITKRQKVEREVNVHERCGTPVEFILSKQWFIKITNQKKQWAELANKINWHPEYRKKDFMTWINNLKWDWCVSRQRFYGVPIPVWYCKDCDEPAFAKEADLPVNPIEDKCPASTCRRCGGKTFIPERDVLDTWATSSVTPLIIKDLVNGETKTKIYPADLRPNAFEIIRTWDFYSVVKSYYHFKDMPFKNVMISGHGLDSKGRKFSKRLGNYRPSQDLIDEFGADAIRYWATGAQLGSNLRFSEDEIRMGHKTAVKLFNVAKFVDFHKDKIAGKKAIKYEEADIWALENINATIEEITRSFEEYAFSKAKDALERFFWTVLTDNYIEFIKYRLFGDNRASAEAAITALDNIFLVVLKLYAPLMPFITEELFQSMYKNREGTKSIHVSSWPEPLALDSGVDTSDFDQAIAAINEIRRHKSQQGFSIGKELEDYHLQTNVNLQKYGTLIKEVMRVKQIL